MVNVLSSRRGRGAKGSAEIGRGAKVSCTRPRGAGSVLKVGAYCYRSCYWQRGVNRDDDLDGLKVPINIIHKIHPVRRLGGVGFGGGFGLNVTRRHNICRDVLADILALSVIH